VNSVPERVLKCSCMLIVPEEFGGHLPLHDAIVFCLFVVALRPCQERAPRRKYIKT
jgi:hypothetical protein